MTLIVEYILFAVNPLQIYVFPLFSPLIENIPFFFLVQTLFLILLYSSTVFLWAFFLTSLYQTLSFTSRTFQAPVPPLFFLSLFCLSCFLFPYIDKHCVILTFPFFQLISRLQTANQGISNITFIFPKLHMSLEEHIALYLISDCFFYTNNSIYVSY